MRYRTQDASGDYTLNTFLVNSPEAVGQAIKTRLALITGEWWLNINEGTPWRTQVLGKYTTNSYDAVLKSRILKTQGVLSIDAYDSQLDRNTRALAVSATVTTIYGKTTIEATL